MTAVLFAYTHKSWNRPLTITALFARSIDGIRAMSRGISAGKLKSKFPNTVIAVEFVYLPKMRQGFNSHAKCTVRFSSRFLSLLLAGGTSTVATASKKSKMVTSTHKNMLFSFLRWEVLHFLLSRIDKLNGNFLHWKIFPFFFPLRNHVTLLLSHQPLSKCRDGGYRELRSDCLFNMLNGISLLEE